MTEAREFNCPTITEIDLNRFHQHHFRDAPLPRQFFYDQSTVHDVPIENSDEFEDEDDLGYYSDGFKRTLTDEQIEIFRHSEIQRFLRGCDDDDPLINRGNVTKKKKKKKKKKKGKGGTGKDGSPPANGSATVDAQSSNELFDQNGTTLIERSSGKAHHDPEDLLLNKTKPSFKQRRDTMRLRRHFKKESASTSLPENLPPSQAVEDMRSNNSSGDDTHPSKRRKLVECIQPPQKQEIYGDCLIYKPSNSTKTQTITVEIPKHSYTDTDDATGQQLSSHPITGSAAEDEQESMLSKSKLEYSRPNSTRATLTAEGQSVEGRKIYHQKANTASRKSTHGAASSQDSKRKRTVDTGGSNSPSKSEDADIRHNPEDYKPTGELFTYRRIARDQDEIKTETFDLDY